MSAQKASRAAGLLDTLGVVTHIDYTDGGYARIDQDLAALRYLGITHLRDAAPNPASDAYGQGHLGDAAAAGMTFVFHAQGGVDPAVVVQRLHAFALAHPGAITGIEGPNEVNNWPVSYQGLTGTAGAQAYQAALFAAVNADPLLKDIPVLGFTDYPVHASASDWNNIHPYPKGGAEARADILDGRDTQAAVDPGKPFAITELGYHTSLTADTAGGWEGVDAGTQAKLLLNAYLDAAELGSRGTYVYELLEAYRDPSGSNQEAHFGLFDLNYQPKPAATAIHNFTSILHDAGGASFTPGSLDYTVQGLPETGHTLLTQKSDGSFQILAWAEPDIWDEAADRAITVASTSTTLRLGQSFSDVEVYDPLVGTAPVRTLHNVASVEIGLSDHPLIVQVRGAGAPDQSAGAAATPANSTSAGAGAAGGSGIVWRHDDGTVAVWQMQGFAVQTEGAVRKVGADWHLQGSADFDGGGQADILWRNDNGDVAIWQMNGTAIAGEGSVRRVGTDWHIQNAADFDGDGKADILWRNDSGDVAIWEMNARAVKAESSVRTVGRDWQIQGTGDFDGDGKADVLWRNKSGDLAIWEMNGLAVKAESSVRVVGNDWHVQGVGDFDGDGKSDILWRNDDGSVAIWEMNGLAVKAESFVRDVPREWHIASTGDYNGDGRSDILWRHDNGDTAIWNMNGLSMQAAGSVRVVPTAWHVNDHSFDLI